MNVYIVHETSYEKNASGMITYINRYPVALVAANSENEACEFWGPTNNKVDAELWPELEYKEDEPSFLIEI